MMLHYSFKVLFANFSNMWKVLLYRLIVMVLTFALAAGLMLPTLSHLFYLIKGTGIFTHIAEFFTSIFTGKFGDFATTIQQDLVAVTSILNDNIDTLVLAYVFLVIIFCVHRFLVTVADYGLADVVNSNMSASARFGFTSCIIRNLGKSTRYALARMLFTIPFDCALGTLLVYMFVALFKPLGFFMPFFVMLTAVVLISFRATLFSGWLPAMVTDGETVFGGLKKGVKSVFSRFFKVYSTWVIMILMIVFIGALLVILTCGVGAIVVLPTVVVLTVIFYLVMYYGAEGKRYYIDHETIVTPKLLHDRETAVSYDIRNNVFFDNTGAGPPTDGEGKEE